MRFVHPTSGLLAQVFELASQALADLTRAALDLAPVTRLDLEALSEAALQAAQCRCIRVLDLPLHELLEQKKRVLEPDARHVVHGLHGPDDKRSLRTEAWLPG
jgi:hypothetical protein